MEAAAVGMQRQIKFTSNVSIKSYPNPRRADGLQPEEPNGSWESESRSIATRRPQSGKPMAGDGDPKTSIQETKSRNLKQWDIDPQGQKIA